MEQFTVPVAQLDYRCPCGTVWQLSLNKRFAVGWPHGKHTTVQQDTQGWFQCVCGREAVFRWGDAP